MGEYATSEDLPMALALSSPIAMDWWRMAGARIYPARFVEHVKKRLLLVTQNRVVPPLMRPSE
jgi:hypothetical protein